MTFVRLRAAAFAAALVGVCVLSSGSDGYFSRQFGFGTAHAAEQAPAKSQTGLGNGGSGFGSVPKVTPSPTSPSNTSQPATAPDPGAVPPVDKTLDRTTLGKPAKDTAEGADNTVKPAGKDMLGNKAKAESTAEKEATPENGAAAASTAAAPAPTPDDQPPVSAPEKASVPDIAGTGNLSQSIAIKVPAYRGLEPKIALNYNSARKTKIGGTYQGWLGYGWGLDGFDVIERASAGYGIPGFDNDDVFLLNGEQLVSCEGTSSPSCLGANITGEARFATENESYRRIRFNTTTNEWKVTDRDGTISTFRTVAAVAGTNPAAGTIDFALQTNSRWLLTSVSDTNGNSVNYAYTCPNLPVCYPAWVGYNGTFIRFYYDQRPDHLLMANGYSISYTKYRLKTINTTVSGSQRGAYALSYDQAPFSNASRLIRVDRYGKDVAIDTNTGIISGGTSKLIRAMRYNNITYNYSRTADQFPDPDSSVQDPAGKIASQQAGDLNFDGKDELYGGFSMPWTESGLDYTLSNWNIRTFDNNGIASRFQQLYPNTGNNPLKVLANENPDTEFLPAGRFIAGKQTKDAGYVLRGTSTGTRPTKYSKTGVVKLDGALTVSGSACPAASYEAICNVYEANENRQNKRTYATLDTNGDAIDELYGLSRFNIGTNGYVIGAADMQANGRQAAIVGEGSTISIVRFVGGQGQKSSLPGVECTGGRLGTGLGFCALADVNGDGATDIINKSGDNLKIWLSTGHGFQRLDTTPGSSNYSFYGRPVFSDFDNDGKADIIGVKDLTDKDQFGPIAAYGLWFEATSNRVVPSPFAGHGAAILGDFNGDGLPDMIDGKAAVISNAGSGNPNLLQGITLETGGAIAVDYTPSTRWTNGYMPQIMHAVSAISVNDGRGNYWATNYYYNGGLYDPVARKFLGYRNMSVIKPSATGEADRPVIETTYRQDLASYGLPELITWRDKTGGTVHKQVSEYYVVNATAKPYTVQNQATVTYLTENISTALRVERTFDAYNNITQIKDYGRLDTNGDELSTERFYSANLNNYIVSLPFAERKRAGFADPWPYIRYQYRFYDGASDPLTPPTQGNLTRVVDYMSMGSGERAAVTSYTYDSFGNKISETNPVGHRTEWDYDPNYHIYPVKVRSPRYFATAGETADTRFVSTTNFDAVCGLPSMTVDPNGITQSFTYDPFCRPYQMVNNNTGFYVNTHYENEGNPQTQAVIEAFPLATGGGYGYKRTYYDGLGRPWRVQTPGGVAGSATRITDTDYDWRSNIWRTAFPRFDNETPQWTNNSYDWNDRVVRTINPDNTSRSYQHFLSIGSLEGTYNVGLTQVVTTDEEQHPLYTYFSSRGDAIILVKVLNGAYVGEYRSYDSLGRLVSVRDAGGANWGYSYDMLGNRLAANDPDLGYWSYVYDDKSRLIKQTDARGYVSTMSYDQLDRLKQQQTTAPGTTTSVLVAKNTYDENLWQADQLTTNIGKLTTAQNGNATRQYAYDVYDKPLIEDVSIDGVWHRTVTSHNLSGQTSVKQYVTTKQGAAVTLNVGEWPNVWQYDASDLLTAIPGYITGITYEADGQTKQITYANGVTTTFSYSPTRRWLTQVITTKGATTLMGHGYVRDNLGRIKTIQGSDNWVYTYDDLSRLKTADNLDDNTLDETFEYSASGNLLSRTRTGNYSYPAGTAVRPHAATQIGAKAISYDANGNMLSDGTRALVWDQSNRLGSVTQNNAAVTLAYGPDGSRAQKSWALGKTLYPDANVEIDRSTPGTDIFTRYPHPDIKIVQNIASGSVAKQFLHRNHLASVRLVTDANGIPIESTGYAAYGERTNTTMQTSKGYIGERYDPETGLMYLNARYYDPLFARFISPDDWDPTKAGVGTNRYAYAENDRKISKPPTYILAISGLVGVVFWFFGGIRNRRRPFGYR